VAADIDRFLDAWSTVISRMGGGIGARSPIGDRRLPGILHPGVSPDR
jgi:hypothetical protein